MADEDESTTANAETKPAPRTGRKVEKIEQPAKEGIATYNRDEANEIKVKTTGDFQLYNPVTRTLYTKDKAEKAFENDQFVQTNIKRGKLKKA